jgi:hypothetical protein
MIAHVKMQNWTAVFLDFVIVVVGVFIGIQVANWNDAREERALERGYLERLHDEAFAGVNGFLDTTDTAWTKRREALQSAYEVIFSDAPKIDALDPAQCNAIANIHSLIAFPHQFPTLEELQSSGLFHIVRDAALRDALTGYATMQENSRSLVNYFRVDQFVMPRAFPAYFESRLADLDGAWPDQMRVSCRLDLMRADREFRNSFTDTLSRFNGYYDYVLRPEIESVKRIHAILDARLRIDHGAGGERPVS